MKIMKPGLILYLGLTLLTGAAYPSAVTGLSRLLFEDKADGSLLMMGKIARGSRLIGQNFTSPAYFWPRPSASDYSALPAAASNLGPTSAILKKTIADRKERLAPYFVGPIPADLLFASASGLDPEISPEAALAQVEHVAKARHLSDQAKAGLIEMVRSRTAPPQWRIFGAPRVNVLMLNLAIDEKLGTPESKGGRP